MFSIADEKAIRSNSGRKINDGFPAERQGERWVASALKKQHFHLYDGPCLEDETQSAAIDGIQVPDGNGQIEYLSRR
ncbi:MULTISPECIES: nitrite reductase (NAD(P)H) small subunit [unclassified Brenneria]|uniref:nitrite reductase (NAD(P)H) small subunit n=1 Tax=unclassified Brenneria TaxID=2634434 RepID=UPI001555F60B|nr:nitrite reductase (NAD(P)H) small subunit [Brenneria sp. hezel4-2-4]MEE3644193.1 nitrite reductase (NAD(P)H) small subunit [Brenneria sp. L3_3C_1]MEE3652417.1 nitrite reductase (NAD(P)H) small subunit [Brenneria sp. HEZEL_4_2_4]NPD02374.1 hypothetical protein [Brenneria sp. hezel4-2-4]